MACKVKYLVLTWDGLAGSILGKWYRKQSNILCKHSTGMGVSQHFIKLSIRSSIQLRVLQIVCKIAPFKTLNYNIELKAAHTGVWLKLHVKLASSLFYIPLCATENKEFSCGVSLTVAVSLNFYSRLHNNLLFQ